MNEPLPPEAYARLGMPHSRLRAAFNLNNQRSKMMGCGKGKGKKPPKK